MQLLHCPDWATRNVWQVLYQHTFFVQGKTSKQTSYAAGNSGCWEGYVRDSPEECNPPCQKYSQGVAGFDVYCVVIFLQVEEHSV